MQELIKIQSELKAPKNQRNNFGNYDYRSLEDILEALKPLLKRENCYMTISDDVVMLGDRFYIRATATLFNSDGKSISNTALARESLDKKGMDSSQITGATSSYARKYAVNGLFLIDDAKDADSMDNTKIEIKTEKKVDNAISQELIMSLLDLADAMEWKVTDSYKIEINNKVVDVRTLTVAQAKAILSKYSESVNKL